MKKEKGLASGEAFFVWSLRSAATAPNRSSHRHREGPGLALGRLCIKLDRVSVILDRVCIKHGRLRVILGRECIKLDRLVSDLASIIWLERSRACIKLGRVCYKRGPVAINSPQVS